MTPAITVFNAVPPTVIASASKVPSKSPSTASIFPLKTVALTVPVLGLYVKSPSDSNPTFPVADASSINVIRFSSFVLSLSATDT